MQRTSLAGAALACAVAAAPAAADTVPIALQLKWFPQAQFAGYFVAKDKGFYAEEGLDVTLLPIGDQSPIQTVVSGAADFGTTWIADLLAAREKGLPVVHIAQVFQRSGFAMVALKATGLKDLCDLEGRSVGVWPSGNEYPAVALFRKCGLTSSLDPTVSKPDVTAVTYPFDPALVFPDRVDVVSAMIYNEVDQIVGLGYDLDKLDVWLLPDQGINLLEDLIFTTERVLAAENYKGSGLSGREIATRLLRASLKGWAYAVAHQEETVENHVLPVCGNTCMGSGTRADARAHQIWQMREIAKLYAAGATERGCPGFLDPAAYAASVQLLVDQRILSEAPDARTVDYGPWQEATGKTVEACRS
ncbi:Riboflavin-binding protein RibY [bacterium HR40]|nr:Riboflavin-binding protein RibY [bacterium HR40]